MSRTFVVVRVIRREGIPRTVADVQHGHDTVALGNRVDNPVATALASVKQVARVAAFRNGCASGRVLVEA